MFPFPMLRYFSPTTTHRFPAHVPVCPAGTFGPDCSGSCTCNTQNSVSCDHVSGTCNCTAGWEGNACDVDIDECTAPSGVTCPANSNCINTAGSYVCACETGYYKDSSGLCQGKCHLYQCETGFYKGSSGLCQGECHLYGCETGFYKDSSGLCQGEASTRTLQDCVTVSFTCVRGRLVYSRFLHGCVKVRVWNMCETG